MAHGYARSTGKPGVVLVTSGPGATNAVTGIAKRKQLLLNRGVRAGDRLYLTKPLGTGILATALKQGKLDPASTQRHTKHMTTLNRAASEAAVAAGARRSTRVPPWGAMVPSD